MAKPRPTLPALAWEVWPCPEPDEKMAELMPMTWPAMLNSGPPELPGLRDASVWMAL